MTPETQCRPEERIADRDRRLEAMRKAVRDALLRHKQAGVQAHRQRNPVLDPDVLALAQQQARILIALALRIMTLITSTDRPAARRLLRAFHRHEITMTRIRAPGQEIVHLAPLPDALTAILTHLGLSGAIYTDLTAAAK